MPIKKRSLAVLAIAGFVTIVKSYPQTHKRDLITPHYEREKQTGTVKN